MKISEALAQIKAKKGIEPSADYWQGSAPR